MTALHIIKELLDSFHLNGHAHTEVSSTDFKVRFVLIGVRCDYGSERVNDYLGT